MAFTLPTFNLSVNIWRSSTYAGIIPPVAVPDVTSLGNLATGPRQIGNAGWTVSTLLLPALTDVRYSESGNNLPGNIIDFDLVECPAGSGRCYQVDWVEDLGKGFSNEHRLAALFQIPPWPQPIP